MILVIRSQSERGYWSDIQGWVYDVSSATEFFPPLSSWYLPMSKGNDAEFVPISKAKDFDPDGDVPQS